MDSTEQENPRRRGGVGVLWVLVLMVASFVVGVLAGLHPSLLPIPDVVMRNTPIDTSTDDTKMALPTLAVPTTETATTQTSQPATPGQ